MDVIKKKVLFDFFLNIIATVLPIAILQIALYPQVAKCIGGNEYGLMLTIYSIWMVLANSLGNVLNNIKLLYFVKYSEIGEEGDIALLLKRWFSLILFAVFALIWLYCGNFSLTHVVLGTIIASLVYLKAYLEVGFRIKLNYFAVFINNSLLGIGFYLGYLAFYLTEIWEFIFLFGYLFSCLYCINQTPLLSEVPKKTVLYSNVKKDAYSLAVSVAIKNLTTYADKLILYPLMGGMAVSIYYTATILGKIAGMLTSSINGVVLSYIAKWDKSKADIFSKVVLFGSIVCFLGYFIVLLFAKPVIGFLFPQWFDAVMDIIMLTTATVMLNILSNVLNPFIMKYCKMQWQVYINIFGTIAYFGSALVLWNFMGLKGFCIGTVIGAVVNLIFTLLAYYKNIRKLQ